jgi:hypothetical protein
VTDEDTGPISVTLHLSDMGSVYDYGDGENYVMGEEGDVVFTIVNDGEKRVHILAPDDARWLGARLSLLAHTGKRVKKKALRRTRKTVFGE